MNKIINPKITGIDVDDTIIYWDSTGNRPTVAIDKKHFEYNEKMLHNIDQLHARGFFIIVWSQSGEEWCEKVVEALGIKDKIAMVMTKPAFYYDDLDANAWMRRINP